MTTFQHVRFCDSHFRRIELLAEELGLGHLIAADGEAVTALIERLNTGADGDLDFEPLIVSCSMLTEMAIGLHVGALAEGGFCPVCVLTANDWALGAVMQCRNMARERGLLLPPGLVP